jgi:hypothetical protein
MFLNEFFRRQINEGGNLASHKDDGVTPIPGWQGVPGVHQAQELDLNVHNRTYVVQVLSDLLHKINDTFARQYKEPLWHEDSVEAQKFLSGSTAKFFDKKISDEEFVRVKPKVGDIDTQAPDKHAETIRDFLSSLIGKSVGNANFIGFSPGNNQYTSMWEVTLDDLPVKLQIDFEYGAHDPETGLPTEWQEYSHSSSWDDLSAGIKGVFHKYIDRALPYAANVTTKYVARVLKTSTKISPEPVTDSDYSFAVSGQGGGGVSRKYVPYNDPNTGEPMEKDGIPVMQLLDPKNRQYIQSLSQQFEIFFGKKPTSQDQQLKNSFVGTVQLANKYLDDTERTELFNRFVSICFEPGSQMITKNDPVRDRNTKMAAIDHMIENMKLPNAQGLRKQAIQTAMEYEQAFTTKKAAKAPAPINEAEVKAQLRKGMPHLHDLKAPDFLDLLDEIHDGNGNFKLENIPLNVKVDGFGGRFGKNADGQPFMGTSRTEPRYQASFVKYHQEKGTTDPEILGRAKMFDDLFNEMMNAIKLVDSKLGPDFLIDKQVTCEVLFLPFATETPEGKLKFVGIHYDKLPEGVQLALVPFHVVEASTGEPVENDKEFIDQLLAVGQQGSVMFINNRLTQKEGLDVTEIINVLDNIEELKQIVSDTQGKRDRASLQLKKEVEEKLLPIKDQLEQAIINDPNIIGKDMLGQDYEGIVINSRLGPIKVTSQKQRDVISAKLDAKKNARTERPRDNQTKTAVVAIGSFVGHKGHQELWDLTQQEAQSVGGDPYLFIGNAEGKDDPIPVADKVKTWHQLYPQFASNISAVTHEGGSIMQKIKHELINPLPGKPPRYDNIIIMVGEDRKDLPMGKALMKAVNKFAGYEHVKVDLKVTPRGQGVSGTALRNILKTGNPNQQYTFWNDTFNGGNFGANKLSPEWIKHLMDVTKKGMGITTPSVTTPIKKQEPAMAKPQPPVQQPAPVEPQQSLAESLQREIMIKRAEIAWQRELLENQNASQMAAPSGPEWDKTGGHHRLGEKAVDETKRMSTAVKLQRAWERQQAKSAASRERGNNILNPKKAGETPKPVGAGSGDVKMSEDHQTSRLWMMISNLEKQAKLTKNDLKRDHLLKMASDLRAKLPSKDLGEFAPPGGDDGGEEDILLKYARMWYNGDLATQQKVEKVLDRMGWEIGELESEEGGCFVVRSGDENGNSYIGFAPDDLSEAMLPKSAFTGSDKNKLGRAGQLMGKDKRPARQGDLVGASEGWTKTPSGDYINQHTGVRSSKPPVKKKRGEKTGAEWDAIAKAKKNKEQGVDEEKQRLDPKCWKGYRKAGTKMKGGVRVNNCVPVGEDIENLMAGYIKLLESKK